VSLVAGSKDAGEDDLEPLKSIRWTACFCLLVLALPLSRRVAGQVGSAAVSDVIVLLGHSHVQNWPVKSLAGFQIINRGRSGDHTQDLLKRFERDVASIHPRAVVVWASDNDIMDAPNHDTATATRLAEANLSKLIQLAKARAIVPILTTEVTIRPAGYADEIAGGILRLLGKTPYEDRINSRIVEGNRWMRGQAQRHHLLLLDFQRALADSSEQRRPEYAAPDGIHLTREAYDVITAQAEATLGASLRRMPTTGSQ
jgi:lysophospholipase L1-like esterase